MQKPEGITQLLQRLSITSAGVPAKETAEVLQISHATVERDWKTARAWLRRELK